MTMNRHEPFEELISASLSGDLSAAERRRLDAHLDACPTCRATLAAFAEQRRIMSGLRHVAPPRDLGARVRTGVERGTFAPLPWWRRPVVLFAAIGGSLAAVAGALLALVLLNGAPEDPPVGQASATPTAIVAPTESAEATPTVAPATPAPTSQPSPPAPTLPPPPDPGAPAETAPPSTEAGPTATPIPASPEPDVFLAYTGPVESPALEVVDGTTKEPTGEVVEPAGPPIAAELSPEAGFLAFVTQLGQSGMNQVQVTRLDGAAAEPAPSPIESEVDAGETRTLAESLAVDPFVERMTWSPDGRYLAFTVADPEAAGETDVWVFEVATGEAWQLTDAGNAYAGSWVLGEDDAPLLWVSTADEEPVSHLVAVLDPEDERRELVDPAEDPVAVAEGVFVPILNPSGRFAIYWSGRMAEEPGRGWILAEGGAPYLSEHKRRDDTFEFDNERPLFSDLTIDRDAFNSAAISWGPDGVTYAVSEVHWTGSSQGREGVLYPDPERVYFGHATDPRGLTQDHAIDLTDVPEGSAVVDVKVSPTGHHLVITALRPVGGVLDAPKADLLLVTRNTGEVPDEVELLGDGEDGWFGPAAFDTFRETVAED
jgi:hypothetical protein